MVRLETASGSIRLKGQPGTDVEIKAEIKKPNEQEQKIKLAVDSSLKWLGFIDDGNYSKGWDKAAGMFKALVNKEQFKGSVGPVRRPLGKLISRKVKLKNYTKQVPGAPDGEYVIIEFDTSFENKKASVETVVMMLDTNSQWRMSGYYIR